MEILSEDRIRGSVFDLSHALSLSESDCNVLLVSSRTLYFVQTFAEKEVAFPTRYATAFLDGGLYVAATTPTQLDQINTIRNNYGLEVLDVTCDLVSALNGIANALTSSAQSACGCVTGGGVDTTDGVEGGPIPDPIGDIDFGYVDPAVTDRKCKASNWVFHAIRDIFVDLADHDVAAMGALGVGVVVTIVGATIAAVVATPLAGLVVAVSGIILTFAARVIGLSIDLDDIVTALNGNDQALICALFEATSADGARTEWDTILTGPLSTINKELVMLLMQNAVLDILFFSSGASETFLDTYVSPISCATCQQSISWYFQTGLEGWTFFDDSVLPSSASGSWDSSDQAIENHLIQVGAGGNVRFYDESPVISVVTDGTQVITVEMGDNSGSIATEIIIYADYSGAPTESQVFGSQTGPATLIFTPTTVDTMIGVRVRKAKSGFGPNDWTYDVLSVVISL